MKFLNLFIILNFFLCFNLYAQKDFNIYQSTEHVELAISARGSQSSIALSGTKVLGIGKNKRFKAGLGLRYSLYFGRNQNFTTAPARLTSGITGPTVIFTEDKPANIDTLNLPKSQVHFINAAIFLQYSILPRLDLGFNIDAIGFSFGSLKDGFFSARESDESALHNTIQSARPTKLNLLLTSDNDIGSLNSEFFLRYWVMPNMGIKIGYTFLFAEYRTVRKLTFDNDRFRNKAGMFMIGFSYAPFKK